MKKLVMTRAWEMYRKGFARTFGECLKASWALTKKENNCFQAESMTQEQLNNKMRNDRRFRHAANNSNTSSNVVYKGAGRVEYVNRKLWVKEGIVRVYATETIDNINLDQTYIQVRI